MTMPCNALEYGNEFPLPLSPSCSTNYELLGLAGSMHLPDHPSHALRKNDRVVNPLFSKFLQQAMYGHIMHANGYPLLDSFMPAGDDRPVAIPRARFSKPRTVPLPDYQKRHGSCRGPHNKSLHPIGSVGTSVARCPIGAATAAPPAPTGELNRYVGHQVQP
jgi:hypothetical protein